MTESTYRKPDPKGTRCTAHRTDGSAKCKNWAIRGGNVCVAHGGRAKQVQAAARARLDDMVSPALKQLRRLIDMADSDASKLRAIENVLDRTGYRLPERIEADNLVTIRVEYATPEGTVEVFEAPTALGLGKESTNGTRHQ